MTLCFSGRQARPTQEADDDAEAPSEVRGEEETHHHHPLCRPYTGYPDRRCFL